MSPLANDVDGGGVTELLKMGLPSRVANRGGRSGERAGRVPS